MGEGAWLSEKRKPSWGGVDFVHTGRSFWRAFCDADCKSIKLARKPSSRLDDMNLYKEVSAQVHEVFS